MPTSEELLAMYPKPLFSGGHHLGVHWHPGQPHLWAGRWETYTGSVYYKRFCICGAYERWGEDN